MPIGQEEKRPMSENELKRELARLQAENAKLKAEQGSAVRLRMTDSGYIEIHGIPGKGKYSISNTPDGWSKLFELQPKITEYVNANRAICDAKLAAYRSTRATG
jgi:hypothetical protein